MNDSGSGTNDRPLSNLSSNGYLWYLRPRLPEEIENTYSSGLQKSLIALLYWRGIRQGGQIQSFLEKRTELPVDPFAMKDMRGAVDRIWRAINRREPIVVYGDYDADGVTSSALLFRHLKRYGVQVYAHIPNRASEGYGLSSEPLAQYRRSGASLIITVDNGISAHNAVAEARRTGFDVIITDHHPLGDAGLPDAHFIVNPKRQDCAYPEKMLAGVGVTYRLCQALACGDILKEKALAADLPLVATGSVADVVPLNHLENRELVARGLAGWNEGPLGLRTLMKSGAGGISASDIGFRIGPQLNAAGRLEQSRLAFELLISDDEDEAKRIGRTLDGLNEERKRLTRLGENQITHFVEEQAHAPVIIALVDDTIPVGIVGLLAGRMKDMSGKPSIVLHDGNDGRLHGSGRGTPGFNFGLIFSEMGDLVSGGGHKGAAGFSFAKSDLDKVKERLGILFADLRLEKTIPLLIDLDLTLGEAGQLWNLMPKLEPFGEGNSSPVIVTRNLFLESIRELKNNTLRFTFVDRDAHTDGAYLFEGTLFQRGGNNFVIPHIGEAVDIVYTMERPWRGGQGFPWLPMTAMLIDIRRGGDEIPSQMGDIQTVIDYTEQLNRV